MVCFIDLKYDFIRFYFYLALRIISAFEPDTSSILKPVSVSIQAQFTSLMAKWLVREVKKLAVVIDMIFLLLAKQQSPGGFILAGLVASRAGFRHCPFLFIYGHNSLPRGLYGHDGRNIHYDRPDIK